MEEIKTKPKPFWKTKKFIFLVLGIVAVIAYILFQPEEEVQFITEEVIRDGVEQVVSVTGSVESNQTVELRFQQTGMVENVYVYEGQMIEEGDVLASLENELLEIGVERSKAMLDMAVADLNLKYAGPTSQQIDISKSKINEAVVNIDNSRQKLEDTKLINNENIKQAEFSVENAELAVKTAQTSLENIESSGETSEEKASTELEDAYEDAESVVIYSMDIIQNSLDVADSILGVDDPSANQDFEHLLAKKDITTKDGSTVKYEDARDNLVELEDFFDELEGEWAAEDVEILLEMTETMILDTKDLIDQLYIVLENTETNSNFTEDDLDLLKSGISLEKTTLSSTLSDVQSLIQIIDLAKLGISSTEISTMSEEDIAKSNLEEAEKNLQIAESNRETVKVENQISANEIQREISVHEIRLEQTQAEYRELVADPRWVDVAALQAKVSREQADYDQSQKNLNDTNLKAPTSGVITEVKIDVGENITFEEWAVTIMADELQIKSNISETDITKIEIGDKTEITFDAYPPDHIFEGEIVSIDPAETVIQGVVYYEVTVLFDPNDADIKSGMTANIDIMTASREDVITVSPQAINYEGTEIFVYVLENGIKEKRPVEMGLEGDYSVEIISGLKEGEEVILYENNK